MAGIKLSLKEKKCHDLIREQDKSCAEHNCKNHVDLEEAKNCAILAAEHGPMTLQEIGDVFGVSRMRICQIEKSILAKLRKPNSPFKEFNNK